MRYWLHSIVDWLKRLGPSRSSEQGPPDWPAIDNYAELVGEVDKRHGLSGDAFLSGPFTRYLELASDPSNSARASARVMECCRSSLHLCAERNPQSADITKARARIMAAEWFASEPHGDYMLEVLDGLSNHNYRVSDAKEPAA